MRPRPGSFATLLSCAWFTMFGCQSSALQPISTEDYVDLARFMGDWYVIAHIPTFIERHAYNAVESYSLADSGEVDTRFVFNQGASDGARKVYTPTGFVQDQASNAVWKMQFIWPIKADYRIVHVDDDYQETIIGREARDFVWIMARSPTISEARYERLLRKVAAEGYDLEKVRKVPHAK